jgi:preprotein translocase subunit SecE
MALNVYKPGQGYWTRVGTACGAGALILWGIWWLTSQEIRNAMGKSDNALYVEVGVGLAVLLVMAGVMWWLLNHPRIVEFMIDTEAEMRKVNWPSKVEVFGSTWIVICGTFMFAIMVWIVDLSFLWFFGKIGILPTG